MHSMRAFEPCQRARLHPCAVAMAARRHDGQGARQPLLEISLPGGLRPGPHAPAARGHDEALHRPRCPEASLARRCRCPRTRPCSEGAGALFVEASVRSCSRQRRIAARTRSASPASKTRDLRSPRGLQSSSVVVEGTSSFIDDSLRRRSPPSGLILEDAASTTYAKMHTFRLFAALGRDALHRSAPPPSSSSSQPPRWSSSATRRRSSSSPSSPAPPRCACCARQPRDPACGG